MMSPSASINSFPIKQRNSSVELFRIIATFTVMVSHFNGWFLDMPGTFGETTITTTSVMQTIVRASSCICVNMFLVITGYYGVNLKLRSIWNLFVMLFFIYVPFQILSFIYHQNFSWYLLIDSLFAFTNKGYYIQCYIMLLFFSPIFNRFIESEGKKVLKWTLVFWLIEFWFDIIRKDSTLYFNNGYSAFHFFLMYMLGRCFYLYREKFFVLKSQIYISLYVIGVTILSLLFILNIPKCWAYTNPIVIILSFCVFVPFSKITFYNKFINNIARSTLPVFIMHTCGVMFGALKTIDIFLYSNYEYWLFCILIFGVQICVFIFCVIYDKCRRVLTEPLTDRLYEMIIKNKILIYDKG